MIIIAESGSTKTDWCIYNPLNKQTKFIQSQGINPYFFVEKELLIQLKKIFPNKISHNIIQIYFYGTGCSQAEQKLKVSNLLSKIFINASILVETDLLAAARGAFGKNKGLICILGTGSNVGLYINDQIAQSFPSLGYIFGDEGSGSHIGKKLIDDFLNNKLPPIINHLFLEKYQIEVPQIIKNVYSCDYPNRYLASFTEFIYHNIQHAYCINLVCNSFDDFIKKRLAVFSDYKTYNIKFTGSVAYLFKDLLQKTAKNNDLKLYDKNIFKSPLKGLLIYHQF